MGRIGRLALRAAMGAADRQSDDPYANNRLEIAHINEIKCGILATAHLLEFDSIQGRWRTEIAVEGEDAIRIEGHRIGFSAHAKPAEIPWAEMGVEVVLDCTGKFLTPEALQGHFDRGAKRTARQGGLLRRIWRGARRLRAPSGRKPRYAFRIR